MIVRPKISKVVERDNLRITTKFIEEAFTMWDECGQGDFALWLQRYVSARWIALCKSN